VGRFPHRLCTSYLAVHRGASSGLTFNYLPPQFRPKYTALLAKKLLVCAVVVA